MANALYDYGKDQFLQGNVAWLTDTIKAVLVDTGAYTANMAIDQTLSDIAGGARIATVALTTSAPNGDGTADATDATFTTVSGASVEAVVIYKDTGVESTSTLIAYIDTATSGLPVTPNGGDISIAFNASGIFSL